MLRKSARCSICLAILGRCSLIWMPGTEVGIALYSLPAFKSNVCDWAGPPCIHRRMHDLCLVPWLAARAARSASSPNQPDVDPATTPAAASLSSSRRDGLMVSTFQELHFHHGDTEDTEKKKNSF